MAREWDDLDLEIAVESGRQRQKPGHAHTAEHAGKVSRCACPLCGNEVAALVLGCADCVPEALTCYATHMFIDHRAELEHALGRFRAGVALRPE